MIVIHIVPSLVKGSGVTEMLTQINDNTKSKGVSNFFLIWNERNSIKIKNTLVNKSSNPLLIFFFYIKIIKKLLNKKEKVFFIQHGLWHPIYFFTSIILKFLKKEYSIVTHGMLMQEALKVNNLKKKIAFFFYQNLIFSFSKKIIFTNNFEKKNSKQKLDRFKKKIYVANVGLNNFKKTKPIYDFSKTIISFSRVHPIKSFETFINEWDKNKIKDWKWFIYGPIDDKKYFSKLKYLIKSKYLENTIIFKSPIYEKQKKKLIFRKSSFLLQTSKSENFNFSISEALENTKPVIVTVNSPWDIVKKNNLGYQFDTSPKSIRGIINSLSSLNKDSYSVLVDNIMNYDSKFTWSVFLDEILH